MSWPREASQASALLRAGVASWQDLGPGAAYQLMLWASFAQAVDVLIRAKVVGSRPFPEAVGMSKAGFMVEVAQWAAEADLGNRHRQVAALAVERLNHAADIAGLLIGAANDSERDRLSRAALSATLLAGAGNWAGPKGRPKGSGGYSNKDAPLIAELRRRISSGENGWAVACELAAQADGVITSPESKARRLYRRRGEK